MTQLTLVKECIHILNTTTDPVIINHYKELLSKLYIRK
jgi:hypothetical protein